MEFSNLKKELQKFIEQAEELAIESIRKGSSFIPYIYCGNKKIKRIVSDSLDGVIEIAEEEIEDIEENTVVLVFEDKISLNDGTFDAIVLQLYDIDEEFGYSFGVLYKIENGKILFLNKRIFLGNVRNCLVF